MNETLLLEALKKAPNKWDGLLDYNTLVYNDPGGPQDRGANLDSPFAENNTGFIGSGTWLRRTALHDAQVILWHNFNWADTASAKQYGQLHNLDSPSKTGLWLLCRLQPRRTFRTL